VYGSALPKTKEGDGAGALGKMPYFSKGRSGSTDDVITRGDGDSGYVCYARQ